MSSFWANADDLAESPLSEQVQSFFWPVPVPAPIMKVLAFIHSTSALIHMLASEEVDLSQYCY